MERNELFLECLKIASQPVKGIDYNYNALVGLSEMIIITDKPQPDAVNQLIEKLGGMTNGLHVEFLCENGEDVYPHKPIEKTLTTEQVLAKTKELFDACIEVETPDGKRLHDVFLTEQQAKDLSRHLAEIGKKVDMKDLADVFLDFGDMRDKPDTFVSATCKGDICSVKGCGKPASHKIGEEITDDDPLGKQRHNLTNYVCEYHFNMVICPYKCKSPKPEFDVLKWLSDPNDKRLFDQILVSEFGVPEKVFEIGIPADKMWLLKSAEKAPKSESGFTEQQVSHFKVHGKGCGGCKIHKKDVMITFVETPDGKRLHDVFLTEQQAKDLSRHLSVSVDNDSTPDHKLKS